MTPLLCVRHLRKAYGNLRAIDDVSFDVNAGEVVAVLGANGAGKTTTFRCVLGVTGFEGEVEIGGLSVGSQGKAARRLMGYLPQTPDIADGDTCAGLLSFLAELRGVEPRRVTRVLEAVDLRRQANTKVSNLSGGMKQRRAFAAARLADPPLLLLDEPTSSLDVERQAQFQGVIRDLRAAGKTALIATHYANRLSGIADKALVLEAGRLVFFGPMSDLPGIQPKKSFVVSLNGTSIDTFKQALAGIGVSNDRIKPVETAWDEVGEALTARAIREQKP
jgi:ABC-type multidrug transport system ATPase subunit